MNRLKLLSVFLLICSAMGGCQQSQTQDSVAKPQASAESPEGSKSKAGDELLVNPNGQFSQPGSALGKK